MDKLIIVGTEAQQASETVSGLPADVVKISHPDKVAMIHGIFPEWTDYAHFYVRSASRCVWGCKAFEPVASSPVYRLL